ncbi:MAG TPA: TetR family transcriptional regulator [Acidimicrobiia bacterium]|nr:TetR family transcriptional regulator [Acidimicrobiia bacterium]
MTVESTESPSPARIRRRPGRPARIDRASIVRAATELVAETGAEHVTMTSVAERLGVAMPALYYHVTSRDELLGLVGASVFQGIEVPDVDAWDDWLVAFARALRACAQRNPRLVNTTPITAHGVVNVPLVEGALQRMVAAGFTPMQAVFAFDDVVATAINSVRRDYCLDIEAANGTTQVSLFRAALRDFARDEAPLMWQVADEFADLPDNTEVNRDAWFERHVNVLVAGLRASLEGRATLPEP